MSPDMSPLICVEHLSADPPHPGCPLIRPRRHCPCSGPPVSLVGLMWVPSGLWNSGLCPLLAIPRGASRVFFLEPRCSPSCLKTPPSSPVSSGSHTSPWTQPVLLDLVSEVCDSSSFLSCLFFFFSPVPGPWNPRSASSLPAFFGLSCGFLGPLLPAPFAHHPPGNLPPSPPSVLSLRNLLVSS